MSINKVRKISDSLIYGTFILTAANIIVRFIGFIYRILLSRAIGPEGMGVYQLIMPVSAIAFALVASGIPLAVSRLTAERKAIGDLKGVRRIFFISLIFTVSISLFLSLAVILNINWISNVLLKEPRTKGALFVFFPCIIIISINSVFRGYFYGIKNFHHPAFAEIAEQITRIALVFILLNNMPFSTITAKASVAALGMVIGEMASLLYLNYQYHKTSKYKLVSNRTPPHWSIFKSILKIALPIIGVRLLSSMIASINSILIPRKLVESGMSFSMAISTFGILSGMVLPLLFLPFTFTNALSMVMIPNISEDMVQNKLFTVQNKVSKAILITSLIAFPCSAFLFSLSHPIGMLLYGEEKVGILLAPLALIIGLHGLSHTLGGILNGLGKQNRVAIHFLIGGSLQILCTWFLVSNPNLGIYGFIIGFIISTIVIFILHFITVVLTIELPVQWKEWFLKPIFSSIITGYVARISYLILINNHHSNILALILSAIIGIVILLLIFYVTGSLSLFTQSIISQKSQILK